MDRLADLGGGVAILAGNPGAREPSEDVADSGLAGFVSVGPGDDAAVDDTAHSRDLPQHVGAHDVAGGRPHDRDHSAGFDSACRGRRDVGVDVADRDGDPFGQSGPHGGLGGERACARAELGDGLVELVGDERREPGGEGGEELGRGVFAVLQDALVTGRTGVPDVASAQLPDDPVRCLDPPLHGVVDLGVLLEDLQRLRELPLRGDQSAVAGEPRLAAVRGEGVDAVGLALRGMVLPQLHIGVRPIGEAGDLVERGAVGERGHHRACREIGSDAHDAIQRDAGVAQGGRHRGAQHVPVVVGDLEGPGVTESYGAAGQRRLQHTVPVLVHGGAEFGPVGHAHDDGSPRQSAEIDSDGVGLVIGRRHVRSPVARVVLARTTSSGAIRRAGPSVPSIAARRISMARRPTSVKSCRIVVSGGMR